MMTQSFLAKPLMEQPTGAQGSLSGVSLGQHWQRSQSARGPRLSSLSQSEGDHVAFRTAPSVEFGWGGQTKRRGRPKKKAGSNWFMKWPRWARIALAAVALLTPAGYFGLPAAADLIWGTAIAEIVPAEGQGQTALTVPTPLPSPTPAPAGAAPVETPASGEEAAAADTGAEQTVDGPIGSMTDGETISQTVTFGDTSYTHQVTRVNETTVTVPIAGGFLSSATVAAAEIFGIPATDYDLVASYTNVANGNGLTAAKGYNIDSLPAGTVVTIYPDNFVQAGQ